MHTTEHDTGVLFYLFYCKCGCCPSTLINPQIYLKIAASRSKTQIKRYKRRPRSAANDVWTVKQPSETPGGFSTVLVKKKKKKRNKTRRERDNKMVKERKKKTREKEIQQLWKEGLAGWLRGKSRSEEVFSSSPLPLFFSPAFPILFYFHLATSITLFPSLTFSAVLFSPSRVVMTRLFISNVWHFAPAPLAWKNTPGWMLRGFSKEHLVISRRFPTILTHSRINTRLHKCIYTHTHTHIHCAHKRRGAFKYGKIYQAF